MRLLRLLPVLALLAALSADAQTCTVTWTNALGGDWNDGANWSGGSVPGPSDDACVTLDGVYTVTHTSGAAIDVNSFTFGAATGTQTLDTSQEIVIASASTIRANGVVEWSAGYISGGATLTNDGLVVLDGINFNSRGVDSTGTVFRNDGTVRWESEEFTLFDGGVWENAGTLTADLTGSAELRQGGTGANLFDNTGTVAVVAGTLFLRADARHDGAVLTATTGAALSLDAGTHTFAGTTTGVPDGEVVLSATSAAEPGATLDFSGEGLRWRSGYLAGGGTLTNDGLVVLDGINFNSRGVDSTGTVFRNDGTVRWESEEFTLFDGGVWENAGTLTADLTGSAELRQGGTGANLFANSGTVESVGAGTLFLRSDARHDGAVLTATTGSTLNLDGGTHAFAGTTTGTPAGDVILSATSTAEPGAAWALGGTGLQWQTGYLSSGGTLTNDGLVVLDGINFNSRGVDSTGTVFANAATVRWESEEFTLFDGGQWLNTGTLTADLAGSTELRQSGLGTNLFANSGTVESVGAGTLFLRSDARHDGAVLTATTGSTLNLDGGTHAFAGTTTGTPAGDVILSATSTAEPGAAWDLGGTGLQWQTGYLSAGTLTNDGLVVLDGINFNSRGIDNTGTVFVNAATVRWEQDEFTLFDGGVWLNTGTLRNDGPGLFELRQGGIGANLFDNAGVVRVDSGEVDVNLPFNHRAGAIISGNGTFDVIGSTFTHNGDTGPGTSPGLLTWQNDWTPSASSEFVVEFNGLTPGSGHDQLAVNGDAVLDGTLRLVNFGTYLPGLGDTYTILTTGGTVSGTFANVEPPFGYVFDVTYNAQDVVVTVISVPNFDLTAINTSSLTVPPGGQISFAYTIANNTAFTATGDFYYTASGGYQGIIVSGSLAGGQSFSGTFNQRIPATAPPGTYSYVLRIGTFPTNGTDNVPFMITVASPRQQAGADGAGADDVEAARGAIPQAWTITDATPWPSPEALAAAEGGEVEAPAVPTAASATLPDVFALHAPAPNPSTGRTTLRLDLPEAATVRAEVFDGLGRRVAVLAEGEQAAGTLPLVLDGAMLPSGVYVVRVRSGADVATQRITILR